jgi:hypothetical protein
MFIVRQVGLLFALFAGVLTSQLPEFAQQYRQRLGGAIDELQRIVDTFDRDAGSSALTRAQGIEKLSANPDPLVSQQGRRMRETEARLASLKQQDQAFRSAGPFDRIAVMTKRFDPYIARRAYSNFEPAVPVTYEGLVVALLGFLSGFGLWKLLAWPINRIRKRSKRMRPGVQT